MKRAKLFFIVTAMILLNTQILAGTYHANESIKTVDTTSKVAAYELGLEKLKMLQNDTPEQLKQHLGGISLFLNVVRLDEGAYITVQERMGPDGKFIYNAVVHVSVTYAE